MLRNKCSISFREQRRVAKLGKAAVLIGGELEDLDAAILDLQLHQCEHVNLDVILGEYEGKGREDEHLEGVDPVADLNDDLPPNRSSHGVSEHWPTTAPKTNTRPPTHLQSLLLG